MKQTSFFKNTRKEHGGILSKGKRRSKRPLSTKHPIHLTLRSHLAKNQRSLLKHKNLIRRIVLKASKRFDIKVYRYAICGNHLHFLIKGKHRLDIQNFFRVLSGHIAQEILKLIPLLESTAGGAQQKAPHKASNSDLNTKKGCVKNQRKFWELLVYTRLVTWGREFQHISNYILKNTLEALNIIAYQPRKKRFSG